MIAPNRGEAAGDPGSLASPFLKRVSGGSEPFILTSMISLMLGLVWMFRESELLLGHFYRPEMLSITHTLTLGWITMLMMGVLGRLSPRAMGVAVRSGGWFRVQFWLMFVGYTGMVFHFWVSGFIAMASAAILIALAASLQIVNFRDVFLRLRGPDMLPRYAAAAMIHFLAAALLGVLLGFDKVYDVLRGEFFTNIYAHVHLAAVGWVSMMIVGFEHRLLPSSRPGGRTASIRFWILEAGTLGLAAGLLLVSVPMISASAVLLASGFALHAWGPVRMLLTGRIQDRASLWATIALLFLVAVAGAGLLLSLGIPPAGSLHRTRLQFAYGYVGLLGWVTLTITAQVYKLFPMFVWEERFRALWGKEPVPAMKDLYSPHLQTLSGVMLVLGIAGTAAGILAGNLWMITFFHGVVILGALAFLANFFLIARWALLRWPFRPTPEDWKHFRENFPDSGRGVFRILQDR